jgi:short-subunit dehydrogenase
MTRGHDPVFESAASDAQWLEKMSKCRHGEIVIEMSGSAAQIVPRLSQYSAD